MTQIKHTGWTDQHSFYLWELEDQEKQRRDLAELRRMMAGKPSVNVRELLARHWTTILAGSIVGALLLWAFGFIRGIRL